MKTQILIVAAAMASSGCIIYDNDGAGGSGRPGQVDEVIVDSGEEAEETIDLVFSPPQAEVGESFIGTITMPEGEESVLDLITSVRIYGEASITATFPRNNEFLVAVDVDDDAVDGDVDILVEFEDGSAGFIEAAFTLSPEGSGASAASWQAEETAAEALEEEEETPCP